MQDDATRASALMGHLEGGVVPTAYRNNAGQGAEDSMP